MLDAKTPAEHFDLVPGHDGLYAEKAHGNRVLGLSLAASGKSSRHDSFEEPLVPYSELIAVTENGRDCSLNVQTISGVDMEVTWSNSR